MTELQKGNDLDRFQQALSARYGAFLVDPVAHAAACSGSVEELQFAPFSALRINVAGASTARGRLSSHWHHRAFLILPCRGELVVDQYGRTETIRSGDLCCIDSRSDCSIVAEGNCSALTLELDRSRLAGVFRSPDEVFGMRISGDRGPGRMLAKMLQALVNEPDSYTAADAILIEQIVTDTLNHLMTSATSGDCSDGDGDGLIERLRIWVEENAEDPALDPLSLANAFGLSRRSLYRTFAHRGSTPGRWLWEVRLDLAHARLTSLDFHHHSVSGIAYSVGFNDSGHFSRLFKQRFGLAPRLARSQRMR